MWMLPQKPQHICNVSIRPGQCIGKISSRRHSRQYNWKGHALRRSGLFDPGIASARTALGCTSDLVVFRHKRALAKKSIKTGYRSCISSLSELDPEYHQAIVRVTLSHICDQLDLLGSVLVWMAVRSAGPISQGFDRPVVTFTPTIDVLPIRPIFDCCLCHTMFQ
jgi:hypothetical protein